MYYGFIQRLRGIIYLKFAALQYKNWGWRVESEPRQTALAAFGSNLGASKPSILHEE